MKSRLNLVRVLLNSEYVAKKKRIGEISWRGIPIKDFNHNDLIKLVTVIGCKHIDYLNGKWEYDE